MICPVCGNDTFDNVDFEWNICPECFWEYDSLQVENPDYDGGANCHSLNEYKNIYWKLKNDNAQFSCKNKADREIMIQLDRDIDKKEMG